jgi:hypothetical protein
VRRQLFWIVAIGIACGALLSGYWVGTKDGNGAMSAVVTPAHSGSRVEGIRLPGLETAPVAVDFERSNRALGASVSLRGIVTQDVCEVEERP